MEFIFDINIIYSHVAQALLAVGLLSALYLIFIYRQKIVSVTRQHRLAQQQTTLPGNGTLPPISIIIYCKDSARALEKILPTILKQNYDAPFEVIVATDGRNEQANDVIKLFSINHHNLRMTYVPDEAHALSRRKLATTLGIKAARYEYIILTDAHAHIMSNEWLSLIGKHFAQGKDVVIGSSFPVGEKELKSMSLFNMLADKTTYLSSALARRPYRCSVFNIAFRRQLFFNNSGFTDSVGLHHGIDDIFLSHITNDSNYAVELADGAQTGVNASVYAGDYPTDRVRHEFTGRKLSHFNRRLMGFGSALMWAWLAATIAAGILFMPNPIPLSALLLIGIIWITFVSIAWHKAANALHIPIKSWGIPAFIFIRPITTFFMRLKGRKHRSANFTWAKPV